jgi:DNA topoisomerase VI subunit B
MKSKLDKLVRETMDYTLTSTIRVAVEKIGEEIAKDILSDETFRQQLKALAQKHAQEILQSL